MNTYCKFITGSVSLCSWVKYNSPVKMRFLAALKYIMLGLKLSEIPHEACWDFKGLRWGLAAVALWRISLPHSSQADLWHRAWKQKQLAAPVNTLKQLHITAAVLDSRGVLLIPKTPYKGTPFLKYKGKEAILSLLYKDSFILCEEKCVIYIIHTMFGKLNKS